MKTVAMLHQVVGDRMSGSILREAGYPAVVVEAAGVRTRIVAMKRRNGREPRRVGDRCGKSMEIERNPQYWRTSLEKWKKPSLD